MYICRDLLRNTIFIGLMRDLGVMNGGVLSDAVISPYPISMMTHVISLNPYIISIIFPIIWFGLNNLWGWSSCGGSLPWVLSLYLLQTCVTRFQWGSTSLSCVSPMGGMAAAGNCCTYQLNRYPDLAYSNMSCSTAIEDIFTRSAHYDVVVAAVHFN